MASLNPHENLDEFFDFDRLDREAPNLLSHGTHGDQHQHLFSLEENMDWVADTPIVAETSVTSDGDGRNPNPAVNANFDLSQWPLSNDVAPIATIEHHLPDIAEHSSHISGPITFPMPGEDLERHSFTAPSSSLSEQRRSGPVADGLVGGSDDYHVLTQRHPSPEFIETIIDSDSQKTVNAAISQSRSSVPFRQASTASWKPASAKRKGPQSRIPLEAKQILEDEFAANPYPCLWEMDIIAHQANLEVKKVRNWFNNTRARKKGEDLVATGKQSPCGVGSSLEATLSRDSLEALDKHTDSTATPPQPPLAVYLAQSYEEEAVDVSIVQAAVDSGSLDGSGDFGDDWSDSRGGRRGSVITSVASSEGTAPTTYTVSSSGSRSNISSFGRDRRRGRRRMAWKESPHNNRQKFNGVNSAGEPQKDLPFFCTFCPRAFKTKYEWIRHEDSVHALRTTWICCDTRPSALDSCPFCGQANPDDAHMAGHKYQQCRSKPESQRTFYRRDHFVQHLHHVHFANAKHPSVRVGCQARLMATEGQHFGCKELAMKWRRFGAPMKRDDPMLHCGFCGKRSRDWSERCEHVAEHLIAREVDRAVWWPDRKENHLENLYSASPFESFRCRYCLKVFTDVKEMNEHSHCRVWSCRFLKSFDDVTADNAGPPLCPDFPSVKTHHCHMCGAGYRTPHSEHAQQYHRHQSCNQEFYTSEEAFLQHLHNFHGASHPALLQGSSVIEQTFMRNKGASFEPVEFNESWQPCLMDLDTTPIGPFAVDKPLPMATVTEKKDQSNSKKQTTTRKKPREAAQAMSEVPPKAQSRPRSDTTSRVDPPGPRFFRLSTYVPFMSSRIFYTHSTKSTSLPRDNQAVVEEFPQPHVASLVMSAGLVSMAAVRWTIKPELQLADSLVELTLESAD